MVWLFVVGCLGTARAEDAPSWMQAKTPPLSSAVLGVTGLSAADCGACHTEIYAEWRQSIHAAAWIDPQFQAELHKDPEVGWLCLNCHTPIANQQEQRTQAVGSVRNPTRMDNASFDPALREEGVTCLACHWRPDGIAAAHQDVQAPHPTVYDPDLRTDAACLDCHQARARLEEALVCHFNTAEEKRAAGIEASCSSCHMPPVTRSMAIGGPVRTGGHHTWPGSGIGKGHADPVPGLDGLDIEAAWSTSPRPRLEVSLRNARAGHMVPTGDPERALELRMRIIDVEGNELAVQTERIGQEWQWSPVATQLSDNRIAVGETRKLGWSPTITTSAHAVEIVVHHVRFSESNLQYHLDLVRSGHPGPTPEALQSYPTRRLLFEKRWRL